MNPKQTDFLKNNAVFFAFTSPLSEQEIYFLHLLEARLSNNLNQKSICLFKVFVLTL